MSTAIAAEAGVNKANPAAFTHVLRVIDIFSIIGNQQSLATRGRKPILFSDECHDCIFVASKHCTPAMYIGSRKKLRHLILRALIFYKCSGNDDARSIQLRLLTSGENMIDDCSKTRISGRTEYTSEECISIL